jgi:hypothetical protein
MRRLAFHQDIEMQPDSFLIGVNPASPYGANC